MIEYDEDKEEKITKAIESFPRMSLKVKAYNFDSEKNEENEKEIEEGG